MSVRYEGNTKIIEAEDSLDGLTDAIADVMLLVGGDEDKLEEAIEQAKGSAELHYNAEKGGNSEGYDVMIDPQEDTEKTTLIPLAEWYSRNDIEPA